MKYSIKDMIAQMLLVGIPNKDSIPGVIELIKTNHIGGVILYKNNYNNLSEMIDLINELKKANDGYNIPLTIAIDQEGGRVNRLPDDFVNFKSSYKLAKKGDVAVEKASFIISELLNKLGINMNFSPVLDIRTQKDDNAFIGNRAFSEDINIISDLGKIYVDNHLKNNVIPVIKHYPGHGNINIDSHFFLPIVRDFSEEKKDLIPFDKLIENNVPALMVGHIVLSKTTKMKPATLSRDFINDFIRKKKHYEGLIITDELGMKAIRLFYGKYRSMKLAFQAGNDIISCKYSKGYIDRCLNMLSKQLNYDELEYHFNKIVYYKQKYNFNDNYIVKDTNIDIYNQKINEINNM